MQRDANIGGFLSQTFEIVRNTPGPIALFVLVMAAMGVASDWFSADPANLVDLDPALIIFAAIAVAVAALAVMVVAQYFLTASMLDVVGELQAGGTRIWAYVGLSILFTLGFLAGLVFLIVPGIILLVRWIASTGYLIGGRRGVTESLSASWDATSGRSWHIFGGVLVIVVVGGVLVAVVSGGAVYSADLQFTFVSSAVSNIASNLFSAVLVAYGVAVYHLIADSTEQTTEVFS